MKLHTLSPNPGSTKNRKRVGRGPGSGLGKTSGRGENGQNSRSGGGVRPGFEGGQNPLFQRIPKRGFSNARFKTVYTTVNLSDLNRFEDNTNVTPALLKEVGIVRKELAGVKILADGKLEKKLNVTAHKFSAKAVTAIEENGGKVEVI